MKVLVLETSGALCGAALICDGEIRALRRFEHEMHLSETLMGHIDACLAEAGVRVEQLTGIGVDVGPGSFTGLRIGVTTAKTLAWSLGVPAAGVDSLTGHLASVEAPFAVAVVRALPGHVYCRIRSMQRVSPPRMLSVAQLAEELSGISDSWLVAGDGAHALAAAGEERGLRMILTQVSAPDVAVTARLAERMLEDGKGVPGIRLEPLYIAPPPIDPRAERKAQSSAC
jgi:tRNA threonylcarbamoyladenosine biosynthesis protein TsaB